MTKAWYKDKPHPHVCCICHQPLEGRKVHREVRLTRVLADELGAEVWKYDLACWREHLRLTQPRIDLSAISQAMTSEDDETRGHVFPRRMLRGAI